MTTVTAPTPGTGAPAPVRSRVFSSARAARRPLVATWEADDRHPHGRRVELPGDLQAGTVLDFMNEHGLALAFGDTIPTHIVRPWMELVLGDKLDDVADLLTWSELVDLAHWAWTVYIASHVSARLRRDERGGSRGPTIDEVLDMWDTVQADFRATYGIDDPGAMPLTVFRAYLGHLPADGGFWRRWYRETDDPQIMLDRAFGPAPKGASVITNPFDLE